LPVIDPTVQWHRIEEMDGRTNKIPFMPLVFTAGSERYAASREQAMADFKARWMK